MNAIDFYLNSPIRVLALWQPWATLCVAPDAAHDGEPAKIHETRHWPPRFNLPFAVAIHAAKKFDGNNRDAFSIPRFREALKRCGFYAGDPRPMLAGKMRSTLTPVPLGAVIGLATVVDVRPTDKGTERTAIPRSVDDFNFGDWSEGRFAWRLADPLMLAEPITHTGRQDALYAVDLELRGAINAQLRAMRGNLS